MNTIKRLLIKVYNCLQLHVYLHNILVLISNKVDIGTNNRIYGMMKIYNKGRVIIGNDNIIFCSPKSNKIGANIRTSIYCSKSGCVTIGDKCQLSNFLINSSSNVTIGNEVMIGGGVVIWDSNFHSLMYEKRMSKNDDDIKICPVKIDDGVFIGANSIIKGAHLGAHCVIGAGSVVMRDIPEGECWAGNPVRFIKKIY